MILYLFGEDTFRSRENLKRSVDEFKKQRDPKGYNTSTLDGKKLTADKFFAEISSAPFLAEKRLVVVENLLSSGDKELLGSFIEKLKEKKLPEWCVIICWQGETIGKTKEAKELHVILQKEKYAREFPLLLGAKLNSWIQTEAENRGGKIDTAAADELGRNATDMWQINSILNQLIAFKNKELITIADLNYFLEEKIDDNVFNLVDAVVSGNHKTAFKLLAEQKKKGEEPVKLFGLFLWQFKILLQIADLLEREPGCTSDEVAERLKINPFVAKKSYAIAKRFPEKKLEDIYREMVEMDLKLKTGEANMSALLDLFVAKI